MASFAKTTFMVGMVGLIGLTAPLMATAAKANDGNIRYTVKSGDTLINMGHKYLRRADYYRVVQKRNQVANPRQLQIGKQLVIPRRLLKYSLSEAKLASVRGRVLVNGAKATSGKQLREGVTLTTKGRSFATLLLADGSRVSLPSNSVVKIKLLRRYALDNSIDYDFAVLRGGARSKVSPLRQSNDRYRVRSPKAVSAVRGTDYQIRYDPESDRDFAEITEGKIGVELGKRRELPLDAGLGLAVNTDGSYLAQKLLPKPELTNPEMIQSQKQIHFTAKPQDDAVGYRYIIGEDAGFVNVIADEIVNTPNFETGGLDNGNYFVRLRAISNSGIQGQPATYAFKRYHNEIGGTMQKSAHGYVFRWHPNDDGEIRYHFQLFRDNAQTVAIVDESMLQDNNLEISDLPPGQYVWRVGAMKNIDNQMVTNWAEFQQLDLSK